MNINRTETIRTYYVEDGGVSYKVVHQTWTPEPEWRTKYHPNTDGQWSVHASQGSHHYARLCDPDKATHQRVVKAVRALTQKEQPHVQPA